MVLKINPTLLLLVDGWSGKTRELLLHLQRLEWSIRKLSGNSGDILLMEVEDKDKIKSFIKYICVKLVILM